MSPVIIILLYGLVGVTIVGSLVLLLAWLSNILPSNSLISAPIIAITNGFLLASWMGILVSRSFHSRPDYFYTGVYKYVGIPTLLYGCIIGLGIFFGARFLTNKKFDENLGFSGKPIGIVTLLSSWVLMIVGIASVYCVIAMLKG